MGEILNDAILGQNYVTSQNWEKSVKISFPKIWKIIPEVIDEFIFKKVIKWQKSQKYVLFVTFLILFNSNAHTKTVFQKHLTLPSC